MSSHRYTVRFAYQGREALTHTGASYRRRRDAERAAALISADGSGARAWVDGFGSSSIRGAS